MMFHQKLFWLLTLLLPVQLGRHFWPEWSYVLGLRVDYLAPTVYLTDLLVIGILISWWWQCRIQNSEFKIKNWTKHHWWVLAVFIYLLTVSLLAQNPGAALYKFVKIIEFALLGFYVAKNNHPPSAIRYPLSLAVIYSSLIALAQFAKQASLGGVFWWLGERTFTIATPGIAKTVIGGRLLMRPYATFPHPNVLAGFILVSMILIGFRCQVLGFRKILHWLAIALGMMAIALSFSRSVWIVGTLSLLPFTYHLLANKKRRIIVVFGSILLALISVFYFAPQFSTEEALSQRVELVKIAIQMIQSAPLTGVGLNNFIVRLPEFWTIQSIYWLQPVHNIFLLAAAEAGLVGLLIFFWFLILTYKRLLVTNNQLLLPLLSIILVLGLFDHYWLTLQQSQLLFSLILGLSLRK